MPVVDTVDFSSDNKGEDSVSKVLNILLSSTITSTFVDKQGKTVATRKQIDDAVAEYSRGIGDVAMYNKWLQVDTNLDKALKKYLREVENLLGTLTAQDGAKSNIDLAPPPVQDNSTPTSPTMGIQSPSQSGLDKPLPTQESTDKPMGLIGSAITKVLTKDQDKVDSIEKDLKGIGVKPNHASALARNSRYKKAEIYPDENRTTPFTQGLVDEDALVEKALSLGMSLDEFKEVMNEAKGPIDWNAKQEIAKGYSIEQLKFAIKDCIEAGSANPENEGYYHDEASIYRAELQKRMKGK